MISCFTDVNVVQTVCLPPGELGGSLGPDQYKVTILAALPHILTQLAPSPPHGSSQQQVSRVSPLQFNYSTGGVNYETLGPDEVRSLLTTVSLEAAERVVRVEDGGGGDDVLSFCSNAG